MKRLLPLIVGLAVAVLCARLGVWQLDRLGQRRSRNAVVEAQLALPPVRLPSTLRPESLNYRRAVARGRFDFAAETVEVARTFRGAPGVHLITPLVLDDGTGVAVIRGWVYSPDGRTVDRARLEEPETATVSGVLLPPSADWRAVHPESLSAAYPRLPLVLRRTVPPGSLPGGIVVLDPPVIDEGPHLGYAIQWFSFAVIAVVGGAVLALKSDGSLSRSRPA